MWLTLPIDSFAEDYNGKEKKYIGLLGKGGCFNEDAFSPSTNRLRDGEAILIKK